MERITKTELTKYLDKMRFVHISKDEYLYGEKQVYTYSIFGNEIYIRAGEDLLFVFKFSKSKSILNYSAICANNCELDITDNARMFDLLKKWCNNEMGYTDFIKLVK